MVAGQVLFGGAPGSDDEAVVPVHSPVSGRVVEVRAAWTIGGALAEAVVVEADGLGERAEPMARMWDPLEPDAWPPDELRRFLRAAGVDGSLPGGPLWPRLKAGLGGGAVVIVAVGCEPGLPSDMLVAAANPEALVLGASALRRAAGADAALVVVERGSPADEALTRALAERPGGAQGAAGVELVRLADLNWTWTPLLLAREAVRLSRFAGGRAPSRGRAVPVLAESAATAVAAGVALLEGRPATERLVAVADQGAVRAVRVPIGTPVNALLDGALQADGEPGRGLLVVAGGPLQGWPLADLEAPVDKATSAISVLRRRVRYRPEAPCLRCGRCVEVCPVGLMPLYVARAAGAGQMAEARSLGAAACAECGVCAAVCPSYRPLVQWIRLAKYGRFRTASRGEVG